jgi:hypothetical protein
MVNVSGMNCLGRRCCDEVVVEVLKVNCSEWSDELLVYLSVCIQDIFAAECCNNCNWHVCLQWFNVSSV